MNRLLTLSLALAFAVLGLVTVVSSPVTLASPGVSMAEISLNGVSDLPIRFGGVSGGVLGDHH